MMNDSADYFEDNCEIQGDLTSLKPSLKLYHSGKRAYYNFQVDVVLLFGLTELKAQIAWKEEVSPCDFIGTMFDVFDMTGDREAVSALRLSGIGGVLIAGTQGTSVGCVRYDSGSQG